jgi:branched-chain amino acid transport system ATP-binding protein
MIEFEKVRAGYGGGDVLQGVTLTVARGSITCVVGPNGAGKSTLLRTLSGLLKPREGTILVDGKPVHTLSPAEVLATGVAQVPQQGGLFGDLTVRDNMLLGGYLIRRDRRRLRRRHDELAEAFPMITERAGDQAADLSGGQRRNSLGHWSRRRRWFCWTSPRSGWIRRPAPWCSKARGP